MVQKNAPEVSRAIKYMFYSTCLLSFWSCRQKTSITVGQNTMGLHNTCNDFNKW